MKIWEQLKKKNLYHELAVCIEQKIISAMKITYNHIAATCLLEYADNNSYRLDYRGLKRYIEDRINAMSVEVNLDMQSTSPQLREKSFYRFLNFCRKRGIITKEGGLNREKLGMTYEQYRHEKIPEGIEGMSPSEINHRTAEFRRDYPIQYMANMVSHFF